MRRAASVLAALVLTLGLTACGGGGGDVLAPLREGLSEAQEVNITARVSSTLEGRAGEYELACRYTPEGGSVEVLAPEEIAGVAVSFGADGGELTFDGIVLDVPSRSGVSPLNALPELVNALRDGQTDVCWSEGESDFVSVRYTDEVSATVELSAEGIPVWAELISDGVSAAVCEIEQFTVSEA